VELSSVCSGLLCVELQASAQNKDMLLQGGRGGGIAHEACGCCRCFLTAWELEGWEVPVMERRGDALQGKG